jgi:hypothetical protein
MEETGRDGETTVAMTVTARGEKNKRLARRRGESSDGESRRRREGGKKEGEETEKSGATEGTFTNLRLSVCL